MKRLTLNRLKEICEESGACPDGMEFLGRCKTLKEARLKAPPEYMEWLLSNQPKLAVYCTRDDWSKLDGYNWCCLLSYQPQLAVHCTKDDWDKLMGEDWSLLLIFRPQLAEHCTREDWDKLSAEEWELLLGKRPQFAEYRK